jgi:hypothetical protein
VRVAIIQSNYIPWKGYFDIIHDVDAFIFLDDVQFTSRDWRSRNRIKSREGLAWLTVPVGSDTSRLIHEVEIESPKWQESHWKSLLHSYSKAPYFGLYRELFEEFYRGRHWKNLSEMNQWPTRRIATDCLGITTEFLDSRQFTLNGRKLDRLLDLIRQSGATSYLSGPSARDYIDDECFRAAGIALEYKDYTGYPTYDQPYPPFEHAVSVLDVLFNTGPDAPYYLWGWREGAKR